MTEHIDRDEWLTLTEKWPDQAWSADAVRALLDALEQAELLIRRQERYIELLEGTGAVGPAARAKQAEARIKAVYELLDENPAAYATVYSNNVRRALDG